METEDELIPRHALVSMLFSPFFLIMGSVTATVSCKLYRAFLFSLSGTRGSVHVSSLGRSAPVLDHTRSLI